MMDGTRPDLREELDALPVVDAHEHLYGHNESQPQGNVTDFVLSTYMGSMLPYADTALGERILDTTRDDEERWKDFVRVWPLVACTGYGNMVKRMLVLLGIPEDPGHEMYDAVRQRLELRSAKTSREAYRDARIEHTITHYLAHPSCGGLDNVGRYLDASLSFEPGFHPLLGTLPLHEFFNKTDMDNVGRQCGVAVGSLEELTSAVSTLVNESVSRGVVGLKDHSAYTRGLRYDPPDKSGAQREFQQLASGECFEDGARLLSDYLFHHIVQLSIDHGIPVAIHTGFLVGAADPKANLRHFVPILEAYPEARFDLYHLNYPWFEDLLAVLKRYPNTWANCCWTHIIDAPATERFLRSAMSTIPANRVFGFGGDFRVLPEPVVAHLEIAKDNIADVLQDMVNKKRCSRKTALEIASLWLYENPKDFYGV